MRIKKNYFGNVKVEKSNLNNLFSRVTVVADVDGSARA